jgi:hypothetical protein
MAGVTVREENWIRTDLNGAITQISAEAALMLGVGRKYAAGHPLPIFFNGDRPGVYRDMRAAYDTRLPIIRQHTLKPRDHRVVPVKFGLQYVAESHELLWTFIRAENTAGLRVR